MDDSTNNLTSLYFFGLNKQSYNGLLYGTCFFSSLTVAVNATLLVATKYASAGKSPMMAFMRCLCLADLLIGLFGVFKSIMLIYVEKREVNCFLPESLLVTASTSLCLLLFWLNLDSYLRLVYPLQYGQRMHKQNIITGLMAVWNTAFVIGFLPQMGWSQQLFECNIFTYYSHSYVTFVCLLWTAGIAGCCFLQFLLRKKILQVKRSASTSLVSHAGELEKYAYLMNVIGTDVLLWTLCYLPFMIYVQVHFINQSYIDSDAANTNIVFFMPAFLLRAFISAFVHSYRTLRVQRVLHNISKNKKNPLGKTVSATSNDASQDLSRSNSFNIDPVSVGQDHGQHFAVSDIACITKSHRKLKTTESVVTIVIDEDEPRAVTKF